MPVRRPRSGHRGKGIASAAWLSGTGELITELRARLGDAVAIVATTEGLECPHDALDGLVLEGFPVGPVGWQLALGDALGRYMRWTSRPGRRPLSIASAYSPLIGTGDILLGQEEMALVDYRAMRFGLAIALLGEGYYAFDNGPLGHTLATWYDEYDGGGLGVGWLGHPQGPATRIAGGAYVRTFTKGMVIVNPTVTPLTFSVPAGHRKLAGMQDPERNDGSEVIAPLVIPAEDAYLLAR